MKERKRKVTEAQDTTVQIDDNFVEEALGLKMGKLSEAL